MSKILLDYFFPVTTVEPTPAASTAFLKQVCVVAKPISAGVGTGVATLCTSMAQVALLTNNTEAQQLFNAGMSRVYILTMDELDLTDEMAAYGSLFYTLLISSDFNATEVVATEASGIVTITSYANLLTTTPDVITVNGTVFTAQAGAATLGTGTFQAATSNNITADSLAAQINAHPVVGLVVEATSLSGAVTIKALETGYAGNDITLTYTDNGAGNIGATLSGLVGGKLSGGDGLSVGTFKGVIGVSGTDDAVLEDIAAMTNYSAFHTTSGNKAKNMFYSFGKLLSNSLSWLNQQYITVPFADDVDELGEANALFDSKISFALKDDEYGNRLGLFAAGSKAIVAPYVKRNLEIDLQSAALSYVSGNMPGYTYTQAALLEDELQKVVQSYIDRGMIESGTAVVKLEQDNFVASGYFTIAEPKALWRIFGQISQY